MSPLEIHILLEIYTLPNGADHHHRLSIPDELHDPTIQGFLEADLIVPFDGAFGFRTTGAAKVLIEEWCSTPLPEQKWFIPGRDCE